MTTIPNAPDANEILFGGAKVPPIRFDVVGVVQGGRIVAPPKAHQEREYDPRTPGQGALKTFPSGDPIYGLTVDVATDQRDPSDPDDTGVRRFWIEGKRLKEAVRNAVQAAGATKLEVGGVLEIVHTGLGQAASAAVNPPKEYQARYAPPAGGQADFFGQGQPSAQPAPPVQQAPPAWAAAPTPQAPVAPPAQQEPQVPGLPEGVQMTPELAAAIAAANAQPQG